MIVDTAGLFPETKGIVLVCNSIPSERVTKGTVFWNFAFTAEIEGGTTTYTESVPLWLTGPVFRALQFKEVTAGRYDVDPPSAVGRKIKCDIVHEIVKDKPYARMKNMIPIAEGSSKNDEIPF